MPTSSMPTASLSMLHVRSPADEILSGPHEVHSIPSADGVLPATQTQLSALFAPETSVVCPSGQVLQVVALVAGWKLPIGQRLHSSLPLEVE